MSAKVSPFVRTLTRLVFVAYLGTAEASTLSLRATPDGTPFSKAVQRGQKLLKDGRFVKAEEVFRSAAEAGDRDAAYALGKMFQLGVGVSRDIAEAKTWYETAASRGQVAAATDLSLARLVAPADPDELAVGLQEVRELAEDGSIEALLHLGSAYLDGHGVERDVGEGARLLTRAVTEGSGAIAGEAAFHLGELALHRTEGGLEVDLSEAQRWFERGAVWGNENCIFWLGSRALQTGDPPALLVTKGRFESLAEKGNPEAQFLLGQMYENGIGVPADLDRAIQLYRMAADAGFSEAMFRLGALAEAKQIKEAGGSGPSPGSDAGWDALAWRYYRDAAEQDHAPSLFNLAAMVEAGRAPDSAPESPMPWLIRSGELGMVPAQFFLGHRYQNGLGVEKDLIAAAAWFDRAASAGHPEAQARLGEFFEKGWGRKKDLRAARNLYRLAADAGVPAAQLKLAAVLANGDGGERDIASALAYATVSARQLAEAEPVRDRLESMIDPEARAEVDSLIAELLNKRQDDSP